jgi:hypothetical protein
MATNLTVKAGNSSMSECASTSSSTGVRCSSSRVGSQIQPRSMLAAFTFWTEFIGSLGALAGVLMVWSIHVGDQWQHEASAALKIILAIAVVGLVESCVRRFQLHR